MKTAVFPQLFFGLMLDRDTDGRPIVADAFYSYHMEQGRCEFPMPRLKALCTAKPCAIWPLGEQISWR